MRTPFTGVGTALITPFRKDGSLDEAAVRRLARRQIAKLKVYAGPDHPHAAQQPKQMEIEA